MGLNVVRPTHERASYQGKRLLPPITSSLTPIANPAQTGVCGFSLLYARDLLLEAFANPCKRRFETPPGGGCIAPPRNPPLSADLRIC